MRPTKSDLPDVPAALQDVALLDAQTIAAAAAISISTWHERVRTGDAPAPAFRAPRCTRWKMSDVRAWLLQQAAQSVTEADAATVMRTAAKASASARAKRQCTPNVPKQ